jgi:hypothetical protein
MRWVGNVACMEEMRNAHNFLSKSQRGADHSEDLGVEERIVLKWMLEKQGGKVWTGFGLG